MTEKNQDFEVYRGDTKEVTVTVTDDNSLPLDMTGYAIRWQAHDVCNVLKIQKSTTSTGNGAITLLNINATSTAVKDGFRFNLVPADTLTLAPGQFYHEAEGLDSFGNISTVMVGNMALLRDRVLPSTST